MPTRMTCDATPKLSGLATPTSKRRKSRRIETPVTIGSSTPSGVIPSAAYTPGGTFVSAVATPHMVSGHDRLSNLSDDLIHKIFSFIDIKDAIKTSTLSSRWKFIWTLMPSLNFSSNGLSSLYKFSKFVTDVLSSRNNQIQVSSVKLSYHSHGEASQVSVRRSVLSTYKFSKFSYQFFTHLATLTTLHLDNVTLDVDNIDNCDDLFCNCINLKSLTLSSCRIMGSNDFTIYHPQISNLTLETVEWNSNLVNVEIPQLQILTIIQCWKEEYLISAPNLASLLFKGCFPMLFSVDGGFHSLEKAHLCVNYPYLTGASKIIPLLQQVYKVRFLTLNLRIIEVLSFSPALIPRASPFSNLKKLRIYPERVCGQDTHKNVLMPAKVKKYLLR